MNRRGFTLIELLVVIAIIVLLVTVLMPALRKATAMGRKAVCQSNLGHIGRGFAMGWEEEPSGPKRLSSDFPESAAWPAAPMDVLKTNGLFVCPEDDVPPDIVGNILSRLTYEFRSPRNNLSINFDDPNYQSPEGEHMARLMGSNEEGNYLDVALNHHGTARADAGGHDGFLRIYLDDPPTAELINYNCGDASAVLFDGEPLFVSDSDPDCVTDPDSPFYGWLGPGTSKNGQRVVLADRFPCSYGINLASRKLKFGSGKVLVADYVENIMDYTYASVQNKLEKAARHLAELNVLYADGSVSPDRPVSVDPILYPHLWEQ